LNRIGKPEIDLQTIKKILIVRLRRIGDIVMTTPAITALKRGLPQASIHYVVEESYRQLIEGNPNVDRAVVLSRGMSTKNFLRHIGQIRKDKYDLVIDFHGGPRAFLITLLSGARWRAGYRIKHKHLIYDIKLPREPMEGAAHSVEGHLNFVKALGIEVPSSPSLNLPEAKAQEKERIQKLWREEDLEGKKTIIFHISAGNKFRDWGIDNLVELTSLISDLPEVKPILVGEHEDRGAAEEIIKKCAAQPVSFVGLLNLRELKNVISRSSLFVGPDSGPMHIAASTSTPIVAYFGPTLPETFSPWQAEAHILEKEYECRPCRQRQCIYQDFRCLRTITPEEVFQACSSYLR